MFAAATMIRVPEGSDDTVEVDFSLPTGSDQLTVFPSARLYPTQWTFGDDTAFDVLPFPIDLAKVD
jgi:hypothetical protein